MGRVYIINTPWKWWQSIIVMVKKEKIKGENTNLYINKKHKGWKKTFNVIELGNIGNKPNENVLFGTEKRVNCRKQCMFSNWYTLPVHFHDADMSHRAPGRGTVNPRHTLLPVHLISLKWVGMSRKKVRRKGGAGRGKGGRRKRLRGDRGTDEGRGRAVTCVWLYVCPCRCVYVDKPLE